MEGKSTGRAMRVAGYPTTMLGVLLLLVFSLTTGGAKGASSCDTSVTISRLIPCLPAVKTNPEPPSRECCVAVANTPADCLCACLQSPIAKVEGIDLQTAIQLPHKCKRVVPHGTKCAGFTIPGSDESSGM